MPPVQRALISVSDKSGLVELARALVARGVELLSTGGTAGLLRRNGVPVVEVADYTGFPEMLDGRVKTLHPRIHGGILARRDQPAHLEAMRAHDIPPIDLVVVNLYPFEQTVARGDVDTADAIENIDIGGPALLRAAAKNHDAVAVAVDPEDYPRLVAELESHDGAVGEALRRELAAKAFAHTARYDGLIANYLTSLTREGRDPLPGVYAAQWHKRQDLRYGENPHQRAAWYVEPDTHTGLAAARQLQGKELSYNNIADADAALACVRAFDDPACVIVKHLNPCGVAIGRDLESAYERAYATDPTSAFGGIVAFNRALDAATAGAVLARQFVEVLIAPDIAPEARHALAAKPNVRVLLTGAFGSEARGLDFRRIAGGLLLQQADDLRLEPSTLKCVTRRAPSARELVDLLFAWTVAKYVKSNAVVYARDGRTLGIGAGQMSRIDSARIAALKAQDAGLRLTGSAMASDAFLPFRDGLDQAAAVGVAAVIQPGGSRRDPEVIAAADEHDIAMVFTAIRHFRH